MFRCKINWLSEWLKASIAPLYHQIRSKPNHLHKLFRPLPQLQVFLCLGIGVIFD